jgi:hypothetical protein
VDVGDAGLADGAALLVLAEQPERRALLGSGGVAAALAAGDGEDADLRLGVLVPLAEGRQGAGLVVGVRPDEQDVEPTVGGTGAARVGRLCGRTREGDGHGRERGGQDCG